MEDHVDRNDTAARAVWDDYRKRQEFEHLLIDHKISWFLTTQTIMFAAYGLTVAQAEDAEGVSTFRIVVPCVGLILGILTCIGVIAVVNSKRLSFLGFKAYCEAKKFQPPEPHVAMKVENAAPNVEWGVKTGNTWLTLIPDIFTPFLFAGAWFVFLIR
ncbi:hypothetical protein [Arthrobacter oryzae]|uniref:hypothetical protein n=1 Tax=Arthrobacter oryzae TaxID=409290 RepID=UPI00278813A5|nr:hypothetical protein [Arthrobacter oryzae]MDQ0078525.1 hypothetical protein [Arthrobacter oryzae]